MEIITLQSTEVPDMPNLEALDNEILLENILAQLAGDTYRFVDRRQGHLGSIVGYKTPLTGSEIVLHICLRDNRARVPGGSTSTEVQDYIVTNKLKVVQAVRHTYEKYSRIIANID